MCKYEGLKPLKARPKIVQGGYDNWYLHYQTYCTGMCITRRDVH